MVLFYCLPYNILYHLRDWSHGVERFALSECILFFFCDKTKAFYIHLRNWVDAKIKFKLPFNALTVLMGYMIHDQHFEAANTLILVMKKYIFTCAYSDSLPNIPEFKYYCRSVFIEQQMIARINDKLDEFNKKLGRWRLLFE